MFTIFLLMLCAQEIYGNNCDNECYLNLAKQFKNLTDSYSIPSNLKDVVNKYNSFNNLTKNVEYVTSQFKLLEELLKKRLDEFHKEKMKYDNKIKNCSEVKNFYKNLTKMMEAMSEKIINLNESYVNITGRIKESNEKSLKQKKELESLDIPEFAVDNSFCNTSLADTSDKMKGIGNNITITLNYMKDTLFDDLRKRNKKIKKLIDEMMNLDKNFEEPLKINEETENLLRNISQEIENLQKKLNNINPPSNIIDTTKWVAKNDEQLKEFERLLQLLFSEKNIRTVNQKIKKAKKLIEILKEKAELRKEFEGVRNIVNHLQSQRVCELVDVGFEP